MAQRVQTNLNSYLSATFPRGRGVSKNYNLQKFNQLDKSIYEMIAQLHLQALLGLPTQANETTDYKKNLKAAYNKLTQVNRANREAYNKRMGATGATGSANVNNFLQAIRASRSKQNFNAILGRYTGNKKNARVASVIRNHDAFLNVLTAYRAGNNDSARTGYKGLTEEYKNLFKQEQKSRRDTKTTLLSQILQAQNNAALQTIVSSPAYQTANVTTRKSVNRSIANHTAYLQLKKYINSSKSANATALQRNNQFKRLYETITNKRVYNINGLLKTKFTAKASDFLTELKKTRTLVEISDLEKRYMATNRNLVTKYSAQIAQHKKYLAALSILQTENLKKFATLRAIRETLQGFNANYRALYTQNLKTKGINLNAALSAAGRTEKVNAQIAANIGEIKRRLLLTIPTNKVQRTIYKTGLDEVWGRLSQYSQFPNKNNLQSRYTRRLLNITSMNSKAAANAKAAANEAQRKKAAANAKAAANEAQRKKAAANATPKESWTSYFGRMSGMSRGTGNVTRGAGRPSVQAALVENFYKELTAIPSSSMIAGKNANTYIRRLNNKWTKAGKPATYQNWYNKKRRSLQNVAGKYLRGEI